MRTLIHIISFVFLSSFYTYGQVGFNNDSPDPSAVLDLSANDKGLLIPRMTTQEREAIVSPATSLLVFDTSVNNYFYFIDDQWVPLSQWSSSASNDDVYLETGNVGIGTSTPYYKLDVNGPVNASALFINGSPLPVNIFPLSNGSLAKNANDIGDWNLVIDPGFWTGNNLLNQPIGNGAHAWKYVIVIKQSSDFNVIQIATDFQNTGTWIRVKDGGNWGAWKRVLYEGDGTHILRHDSAKWYKLGTFSPNWSNIAKIELLTNRYDAATVHKVDILITGGSSVVVNAYATGMYIGLYKKGDEIYIKCPTFHRNIMTVGGVGFDVSIEEYAIEPSGLTEIIAEIL